MGSVACSTMTSVVLASVQVGGGSVVHPVSVVVVGRVFVPLDFVAGEARLPVDLVVGGVDSVSASCVRGTP